MWHLQLDPFQVLTLRMKLETHFESLKSLVNQLNENNTKFKVLFAIKNLTLLKGIINRYKTI